MSDLHRFAGFVLLFVAEAVTGAFGAVVLFVASGVLEGDVTPAWFAWLVGLSMLATSFGASIRKVLSRPLEGRGE